MKSRTSFFNSTVFRKNATRFAPVWIVYTIFLVLVVSSLSGLRTEYMRCINAVDMTPYMVVVNLIYAFVLVQLLFGDLYNARMCNALHAMPLTRDCWFWTNLASALVFSLIPNLAVMLIAMPVLGDGWIIAVYWFAISTMQFIFFLGTAAFSIMLVGNRLAMLAVYVLVNFLSLLAYWFFATLYEPLMYGVRFSDHIFILLSPCSQMASFHQLVKILSYPDLETAAANGRTLVYTSGDRTDYFSITTGTGWGYHAVCVVIGVVLIFIALQLYRRRKLESAGDFIAYKAVEPVFLTLFTLGVGAFFQLFATVFGLEQQILFLAVGLAVGYYAGRMLMRRTTWVFQPKSLIGLAAIAAVMAVSVALVNVDAFGIVRYVPELSEVESVTVGNSYYFASNSRSYELSDPEEIGKIQAIHRDAFENPTEGDGTTTLHLIYNMKDGTTVERYYDMIDVESYAGQMLRPYYSGTEFVLGLEESEYEDFADSISLFWYDNIFLDKAELRDHDMLALIEAIAADCEAGNMIQDTSYHPGEYRTGYMDFQLDLGSDRIDYININLYDSCENTLKWLEDNGFEIEYGSLVGQ